MRLGPKEITTALADAGLSPTKALGQNFVADANTIDRIVRLAGVGPGDSVLEIGPGLGSLTLGLLEAGASVLAVEVDAELVRALEVVLATAPAEWRDRITVVNADATAIDWVALLSDHDPGRSPDPGAVAGAGHSREAVPRRWKLVANLPYNVGTPITLDILDQAPQVGELTVLVQREVADRLAAAPGDSAYGFPSLKVRFWGKGRLVAKVPASVFVPVPRVESGLLRIERSGDNEGLAPELVAAMFELAREAFGQRRKMLRKSLGHRLDEAGFEAAGVLGTTRPERLDVADWLALAEVAT